MAYQSKLLVIPWHLIVVFFLLSLGILVIGYFYYDRQLSHIKQEKKDELAAILRLKVNQVESWRQERLADARVIFEDRFFALKVKELLTGRGTLENKEEILNRLAALRFYQYEYIALLDARGDLKLSFPEEKVFSSFIMEQAKEAMQTQKIIFTDLYRSENDNVIRQSLIVPIICAYGLNKDAVGVVVLRINPYQFLYPLIQLWPTPSHTAETELLRREGSEVVILNELRHRQGTALTLRFPLTAPELVAAKAARGEKANVEGRDYRGVSVLGAIGEIPDSPWFLTAEVDTQEVLAPVWKYFQLMALLTVTLITCAGMGLALIWRNQHATFYRRQFEMERDKRVLAQRYEYLTKYANDIILLADQDLKFVEGNDRAVASYGYEREELLKLSIKDLHPPESQLLLDEKLQHAEGQDGQIFETSQLRKDGTIFPAEISLRLMEVEGQKFYQEIIRDITERKLAEESLRGLTAELLNAQETERQRISLLLHDDLGQALLVLQFQLNTINNKLQKDNNILSIDCEDLLDYITGLIEKVRQLSRDLNPPTILKELGLSNALRYSIEEFSSHYDIRQNHINIDEIDNLFLERAKINIYRIVQEALSNIGRHSKASEITVEIKNKDNNVSFMIEDNGKGFDLTRVFSRKTTSTGVGIPAIKERVRILGGSIDIWSQKGSGTRITINIPLDAK
ncbi:MAG: PAS domain S-box protein [Syntrophales bacterium]|nr:PAS domain S-box protein [Syntrophales bacterium]